MASVGALTGLTFQGDRIRRAQRAIGVLPAAPGTLGPIVSISDGWTSPTIRFRSTELMADGTTDTQSKDRVEAYRGYPGTTQTITDQFGEAFTNCIIVQCIPIRSLAGTRYVIQADWQIVVPPTSAAEPSP